MAEFYFQWWQSPQFPQKSSTLSVPEKRQFVSFFQICSIKTKLTQATDSISDVNSLNHFRLLTDLKNELVRFIISITGLRDLAQEKYCWWEIQRRICCNICKTNVLLHYNSNSTCHSLKSCNLLNLLTGVPIHALSHQAKTKCAFFCLRLKAFNTWELENAAWYPKKLVWLDLAYLFSMLKEIFCGKLLFFLNKRFLCPME